MKTLVVYFSRSGHTEQVAREIAQQLGADTERIREADERPGVWGYCRSALQVLLHAKASILPAKYDPARYDVVVLGTPVWVGQPTPPVRAYLGLHAPTLREVAFFCTEGGAGETRTFAELEKLCGKPPRATLAVTEKQLPKAAHAALLERFVSQLVPRPNEGDHR